MGRQQNALLNFGIKGCDDIPQFQSLIVERCPFKLLYFYYSSVFL